jgi:plastocyanin
MALAIAVMLALPAAGAPVVIYTVIISDMAFGRTPAELRVGDTIEWVNADIFQHSATARDGSFDVTLAPRAHARVVLRRAGSVAFYCRYHPGMAGVLAVSP